MECSSKSLGGDFESRKTDFNNNKRILKVTAFSFEEAGI